MANIRQSNTKIRMHVFEDNLYIYLPTYGNNVVDLLLRFNHNGTTKLDDIITRYRFRPLWSDSVVVINNGYIYLRKCPAKDSETSYPKKADLVCYNLTTGVSEKLISTESSADMHFEVDENGHLYISTEEISEGEEKQYQMIKDNVLLPHKVSQPRNAQIGIIHEILHKYNNISPMLSEDQLNMVIKILEEHEIGGIECELYPCDNGWMLFVGNYHIPLWLILSDGSISPIIEYECYYSNCNYNQVGDYGFLSFIRYEKPNEKWDYSLDTYENDTISGTYRIDLTDRTITKINDNYYSGIFIFDEASIFACDKHDGVYQIDYNGNLINTLIEPIN